MSDNAGAIIAVIVCLTSAAFANGLTQGFLSFDPMELNVKLRGGTELEQRQAKIILPAIERHHLMLVSLLLWNAAANEILPLYLDELLPPFAAIILSITLVLLVGEILPAALCTGSAQMWIAYNCAPMVYAAMILFWPIAYPIAWVLDHTLGEEEGLESYSKVELSALMQIQQEEASKKRAESRSNTTIKTSQSMKLAGEALEAGAEADEEGDIGIKNMEVGLIDGVLKFGDYTTMDIMNSDVFMLGTNDKLNKKTLYKIFKAGYSRFPVYDSTGIKGIILTKDILCLDPLDEVNVGTFCEYFARPVEEVGSDFNLDEVLIKFQETGGHMAIVRQSDNETGEYATGPILGIVTLDDIFSKIMGKDLPHQTGQTKKSRDVELTKMKLLNHALHSTETTLSADDVCTITDYLKVNVPELISLLGAGNDSALHELISQSLVVEAKRQALDVKTLLPEDQLYRRGKVTDTVTLILSGKVQLFVGADEFPVELGPWNVLARDVFQEAEHTFAPDFSAYIHSPDLRYLKISKPGTSTHKAAKAAAASVKAGIASAPPSAAETVAVKGQDSV